MKRVNNSRFEANVIVAHLTLAADTDAQTVKAALEKRSPHY
ncbi:hypothetical protein [Exiguobacterium artemiae]